MKNTSTCRPGLPFPTQGGYFINFLYIFLEIYANMNVCLYFNNNVLNELPVIKLAMNIINF